MPNGVASAARGVFGSGIGPPGASGWEPTVVYMIIFVIGEMIAFGFLSRMLR